MCLGHLRGRGPRDTQRCVVPAALRRLIPSAAQSLNGSCSGSPPLPLREGAWLGPLSLPALPAAVCTCGTDLGAPQGTVPRARGVDRTVPTCVCHRRPLVLHPLEPVRSLITRKPRRAAVANSASQFPSAYQYLLTFGFQP